ncbi:MAG: M23 family metallopeptidase [Ignavibacteriales bacterium]|nr:M23 family metallopeptidase [Ignavibacteriales bacterium]
MSRFKLYFYSNSSLNFIEARWFKTKFASLAIIAGMVLLVLGFELNQFFDDAVGLGFQRNRVLVAENLALKGQLKTIASRLQGLEKKLIALNEQGNELRLLVDLPKIDEDTRKAGFGGTDARFDFGVSSGVNKLLQQLNTSVEQAERELQLQQASYKEAVNGYEANKIKFSCVPAIKPMEGYFSIHGFGMRVHPVYGVMKFHEGLDITNDVGTAVYASGDGVVQSAGRTEAGYGIMVVINHGYGYTSLYAHLSNVLVRAGQQIKRGDLIARSGRTGLVSGPNLHYEIRLHGVLQNPVDYFFDSVAFKESKNQLAVFD